MNHNNNDNDHHVAAAAAVDTDPRFPHTVSDIVTGMATVNRDDFAAYLGLGVPLDESTEHNSEVLLLYHPPSSSSTSSMSMIADDPYVSMAATRNVPPPFLPSVDDAIRRCEYLNVLYVDHDPDRYRCWAMMGQYESYHVQKYMRLNDVTGKLDPHAPFLRYVDRGHQASGRRSMKVPTTEQTKAYWKILQKYLSVVDDVVNEKLRPLATAAAATTTATTDGDNNTVIVMVCNAGQSELLLNFLCSARHRAIDDLRRVLVFATDRVAYEILVSMESPVRVFYDETIFDDDIMPQEAARRYADPIFMKMMLAKVFCVHMTMMLGYDVLFQDVDMIWYKSPLEYFRAIERREREEGGGGESHRPYHYDAYFQDDGNHAPYYAPYSANTGFYFLRNNERTMAFVNGLLMQGDAIMSTRSHQIAVTFLLQEMSSLHGLTVKVWNARTTDEFPGGHAFHRRRSFMKDLLSDDGDEGNNKAVQPYLFHMSWTASSVNKVKFWQQMGEWYVSESCRYRSGTDAAETMTGPSCCLAQPVEKCHYRDKPSKHPCKDSPTIDKNGSDWW